MNDEEKVGYKTYFKYLSEKSRFGVIGNGGSNVKDMYIVPLPSNESLPPLLKSYRVKGILTYLTCCQLFKTIEYAGSKPDACIYMHVCFIYLCLV